MADQLMLWARNKYDLLLDKGTWNAPTEQEEKIIALQAQVKEMAKKLSEKKPHSTSKSTTTKTNGKSTNKKKHKRTEKAEWFTKKPTDVLKTVTWNNREWNWCGKDTGGKCESYVIHKPSECKGLKHSGSTPPPKQEKRVKIKAQQTMIEAHKESNEAPYDDGFLLWIIGIFYYILSWLKSCLILLYNKLNHTHNLNWYSCIEYVINIPFNILIYINERHMHNSFKPKQWQRIRGSLKRRRILYCQLVTVYASTIKAHRITPFDTDSSTIGIDNRASGFPCINRFCWSPPRQQQDH